MIRARRNDARADARLEGSAARAAQENKREKGLGWKKPWSLYILECNDRSLYTGISNDVQRRYACHLSGKGAKYTRTHPPVKLMYVEECGTQGEAMARERQVKRFPRRKKITLIMGEKPGAEAPRRSKRGR